jgi:hypothetical protein
MRKIAFLSFGWVFALVTACAAQNGGEHGAAPAPAAAAPAPGPAGGQGDTLARIHALVGTPSCTEDSQCKTLALGAQPCGGPEDYLAYSSAHTLEPELRALGDAYGAQRRAAHAQAGRMSNCRFTPDPGAVCRAGVCTLGAAQPVAR